MKLGIVGAGMIVSDFLSFAHEVDGLELVALCGTPADLERMNTWSVKHAIEHVYVEYQELLKSEDVDVIYLGVPNHLHFPMAKLALLANKHVICEKPFTSNYKEAVELAELSKKQNRMIIEGVSTRFLPNTLKIKEMLNELGDIKIVSANYSQYSSRYDAFKKGEITPAFNPMMSGGALLDLNIYNLNFVVTLFGKPENVEYFANVEHDIDTSGMLVLDYGQFKCVCTGAKDCKAPLMTSIQGDQGCVTISTSLNVLADYHVLFNKDTGRQVRDAVGERFDFNGSHHRMYHEFVEFVRIFKENDVARANELLEISLITMEIQTIARQKAKIVFAADLA